MITIAEAGIVTDDAPEATGVGAAVMIRSGGSTGTGGGGKMIAGVGVVGTVGGVCSAGLTDSSGATAITGAATGAFEVGGAKGIGSRLGGWVAGDNTRGREDAELRAVAGLTNFATSDRSDGPDTVVGAVPNAFPGFVWISFSAS